MYHVKPSKDILTLVIGTVASLVLFWMYNEIKTLRSEVRILKIEVL